MTCMLILDNLSKSFGSKPLFSCVSCTIGKNERYALIGRNGSGKSTLLKIIAGEEESDSGEVKFVKGMKIGYLAQHIKLKGLSVQKEILDASNSIFPHEADMLLCGLGFAIEDLQKPSLNFSGGYQLRIALARVLALKPDILLLDEPTNYLDIGSIRFLEKFLTKWEGVVIVISHDRAFLDAICTHTMGLYRKSLKKFAGDTTHYFSRITEEEKTKARENENIRKQKAHLTKYVERFRYKASKSSQAQSKMKALEKLGDIEKLEDEPLLSFEFNQCDHPGRQMLSVNNLCFSFTQTPLINKVNIEVLKGETLAIIGKNGSGKSTLLKLLAQKLSPTSGWIKQSLNLQPSYFAQTNINTLRENETIFDEVKQANPKLSQQQVRQIAGKMLFSDDATFKKIGVLSGGERARVLLAQIIAKPTNFILLDEPTNHLDIESTDALIEALEKFQGGKIIVTHNEWILRRLSLSKIIYFSGNEQTVHLGSYESFLESKSYEDDKDMLPEPKPKRKILKEKKLQLNEALRPIKKKAKEAEKEIYKLEKAMGLLDEKLVELYSQPTGDAISTKLKEKHLIEKRLDALYQTLEQALLEEEQIKKEFHL